VPEGILVRRLSALEIAHLFGDGPDQEPRRLVGLRQLLDGRQGRAIGNWALSWPRCRGRIDHGDGCAWGVVCDVPCAVDRNAHGGGARTAVDRWLEWWMLLCVVWSQDEMLLSLL